MTRARRGHFKDIQLLQFLRTREDPDYIIHETGYMLAMQCACCPGRTASSSV